MKLIDGEPAYEARTGKDRFVAWKGRKLIDKFPKKVGKKDCAVQGQAGQTMNVRCGDWQSGAFDYIQGIESVGDAVVFQGNRGTDKYVVVGNREEGPYFNLGYGVRDVKGKPAYAAWSDSDHAFVVLDGKRQEVFDAINAFSLTVIGDQLAYTATKDKSSYVVLGNRKIPMTEKSLWLGNYKDKLLIAAKGTVYIQQ